MSFFSVKWITFTILKVPMVHKNNATVIAACPHISIPIMRHIAFIMLVNMFTPEAVTCGNERFSWGGE